MRFCYLLRYIEGMRYSFILTGFLLIIHCAPDGGEQRARTRVPGEVKGVVDGVDTLTGLVAEGDYLLVKGNCLACHSAKLVTQNRATREGWETMIRWMQAKHGLRELGAAEPRILDYLAEYYAPERKGSRRMPLENVAWYRLPKE